MVLRLWPYAPAALYPRKIPGTHFCSKVSQPRGPECGWKVSVKVEKLRCYGKSQTVAGLNPDEVTGAKCSTLHIEDGLIFAVCE
jgi:hypothetical protein